VCAETGETASRGMAHKSDSGSLPLCSAHGTALQYQGVYVRGVQDAIWGIYNVSKLWEPRKVPKVYLELVTSGSSRFRWGWDLSEQLFYSIRQPCAIADPVLDAIALEVESGGIGAGVVGADNFDRTPIAGTVLFNH